MYSCIYISIYGGRFEIMFRYVDALCLLPLYMYTKTHTHTHTHTHRHTHTHILCLGQAHIDQFARVELFCVGSGYNLDIELRPYSLRKHTHQIQMYAIFKLVVLRFVWLYSNHCAIGTCWRLSWIL